MLGQPFSTVCSRSIPLANELAPDRHGSDLFGFGHGSSGATDPR
jgi:hypothetical protein